MSISGSMFNARTALDAFGESITVVGHNIANLNTAGFKASRVEFADLLPSINGALESGHGVQVASIDHPFQQGALATTTNTTDLAVGGNGFFILKDSTGGTFYSRAGQFHLDKSRNLVNPAGLFVQGTAGNISLAGSVTSPAQPSSTLNFGFNLDSSSTTPVAAFPPGPDASSSAWFEPANFSLVAGVYDSRGDTHDVTFLFRKTGPNTWSYRVVAPRAELDPAAPTSADLRQVSAGGTLVFDANGSFNRALSTISDIDGLTWIAGAGSQAIPAAGLDFSSATQFGQPSFVSSLVQNGRSSGTLINVAIDRQGVITGRYSNGSLRPLGTIQLATFPNADGLDAVGDTLFVPSATSGAAQQGVPGQGGRGEIVSGALELSTVDLPEEFVSMISSQRAFQVNSRVINVADQMYSIAADLKR